MINQVILMGRLTREIELRKSQEIVFTSFEIAVPNGKKVNNEYQADFIKVSAFADTAQKLARYCKRGTQIVVNGRLKVSSYLNKANMNVKVYEVVANTIDIVSNPITKAEIDQKNSYISNVEYCANQPEIMPKPVNPNKFIEPRTSDDNDDNDDNDNTVVSKPNYDIPDGDLPF